MRLRMRIVLVALAMSCAMMSGGVVAGVYEGLAALEQGDYAMAVREFRPLATQGEPFAQFNLGLMYENGQGVPQDYKEAVKWYRLAADQGFSKAQFYLGLTYAKGQGVQPDYKEAMKWFRLAADQKHAVSQHFLGVMYAIGQGVPRNDKEAVKWFRLAADQNFADAQHILGLAYANGEGVSSNRVAAYALFNLSATGDPSKENKAIANRAKLAKSMSTTEIDAAQNLTREIMKPGNFLKALDKYLKNPAVKDNQIIPPELREKPRNVGEFKRSASRGF